MLHLDYRDARPIYQQITDGIRQQIAGGVLQKGDKLPSVRELAAELTINPNTIQRAYRQLEMEGHIATVPGKGCFVCQAPENDPMEEMQLLKTFEETGRRLLTLGYTLGELTARLEQEDRR